MSNSETTATRQQLDQEGEPPGHPAAAGLRTYSRITEAWDLPTAAQMALLGLTSRSTFFRWRKCPPAALQPDRLERLSYISGIYKSLGILLPNRAVADEWVLRPNTGTLYGGRPPIERMCRRIADLEEVHRHLAFERGGEAPGAS